MGFEVAKNLVTCRARSVEIDDASGRAKAIERVREHLPGT